MVRLLPHLWVPTMTMYTASYMLGTCVWTTELVCALTNSNLCYKQGSCLYYWLTSWPHTSSTYSHMHKINILTTFMVRFQSGEAYVHGGG